MLSAVLPPSFQGWHTPSSSGSSFHQGFWLAQLQNPAKQTNKPYQHQTETTEKVRVVHIVSRHFKAAVHIIWGTFSDGIS